jgi:hypothetical protein
VIVGRTVSANGKARTKHDIRCLKHSDRKLAEEQAEALCKNIGELRLTTAMTTGKVTLGQIFSAYNQHRIPGLTKHPLLNQL